MLDLAMRPEDRSPGLVAEARARAERAKNKLGLSRVHVMLAMIAGDSDAALAHCDEALGLVRSLGHRIGLNRVFLGRAALLALRGDHAAALRDCDEGLTAGRELGDRNGIAWAAAHWAGNAAALGRRDEAVAMIEEAIAVAQDLGESNIERALRLNFAGWTSAMAGELALGRAWLDEAVALLGEADRREYVGRNILHSLGEVMRLQGDLDGAEALLTESMAAIPAEDLTTLAALGSLARVALTRGDLEVVGSYLANQLKVLAEQPGSSEFPHCLEGIAGLRVAQGRHQESAQIYGFAEGVRKSRVRPRAYASDYERGVEACREALGSECFTAAWAAGRVMPLEEACLLARSG